MVSLEELEKFEEILKNVKITPKTRKILKKIRNVKNIRRGRRQQDRPQDTTEIRRRAEEILENFIDSYIINVLKEAREDIVNDVVGKRGTEVQIFFHTKVVNELEDKRVFSTQNCIDSIKRLQKRAEEETEISEILKYYEAALHMNQKCTINTWTYIKFIGENPDVDYPSLVENQYWQKGSGKENDAKNLELLERVAKDTKIPKKIQEMLAGIIKARKSGRKKLAVAETQLSADVAAKLAELIEEEPDITGRDAFDKLFRVEGIDENNIREVIRLAAQNLIEQGEKDSDLYRSLVKLYGSRPSTRRLV